MNNPIATYDERRFDGKRVLKLFSDTVAISGNEALGPRFELNVPLAGLNPHPDRVWRRPAGFGAGITMFVASSFIVMAFKSVLSLWWQGMFAILAISGLLLAIGTVRRVEWAAFRNSTGHVVLIVARAGPNKKHFDSFIGAINGAILAAIAEGSVSGTRA